MSAHPNWNGRPPEEHEGAPAHLLRDAAGAQWTASVRDGWWQIAGRPYVARVNQGGLLEGWSYVSPLYPITPAQVAEAVKAERENERAACLADCDAHIKDMNERAEVSRRNGDLDLSLAYHDGAVAGRMIANRIRARSTPTPEPTHDAS
ncbi:hypothetical protein SAMN02745194_04520 [Roseomonas rosea]|uniref:Uncharacterized protein n=1 Tax=Muricoccus roseus TaxID=198092 RepID=A0A1M6QUE7_9PROT|nr:hypothetical protein [Roseomonas rosea]SHK23826.1 hypothetical protein SAMN02745194_04520 [Roseomonas rosea]